MNESSFDRPASPPQQLSTGDFLPDDPPLMIGHSPKGIAICAGLFLLTCASTFVNGMLYGERTPTTTSTDLLWDGLSYAGPLMLILAAHEMGHYLMARWYRVPATLPIFIPLWPVWLWFLFLPIPWLPLPQLLPQLGGAFHFAVLGLFGTMGAVIVQQAGFAHRKATFDIGIAGPLAGLVIALPVAWLGIQQAHLVEFTAGGLTYGDPLILKLMVWWKFGPLPPNHDVALNPLLYAGWVGIFLTGLNLVPISQLDGGHILYTLTGRRAHVLSYIMFAAAAAFMMYFGRLEYALILILLAMMGLRHPPTTNDDMPLGLARHILGWITLAVLFVVCFTPFPLTFNDPPVPPSQMRPLPPGEGDITVQRSLNTAPARNSSDGDRIAMSNETMR
ncbi:MAG: site-2 protease family protein [Planctomycetaceae bacterium]|nr:site-2 protease family protein [Planctomycetaceae bacterium]